MYNVEECFYVSGYDSTIGLAQLVDQPLGQDCSFVAGMKELHAIPFCLTNIPQTMISWSCSNPVYGNTANPHDKNRSLTHFVILLPTYVQCTTTGLLEAPQAARLP